MVFIEFIVTILLTLLRWLTLIQSMGLRRPA